ncbi:MAG: barstar family protein [Oscillospiraceae bacterium]
MKNRTLIIDGASVGGMEQLHGRFYAAFDFPFCYGENLDALHDCLTDISAFNAVIRIINSGSLEQSLGEKNAAGLRRVLLDCAAENPHISVEFTD